MVDFVASQVAENEKILGFLLGFFVGVFVVFFLCFWCWGVLCWNILFIESFHHNVMYIYIYYVHIFCW